MLPARRSADYKGWLAIQLFELAVALGQQQQLDSNGIRQAAFAEDLADTRPELMHAALLQWRRTEKFLPTAGELRDVYTVLARDTVQQADAAAYLQDYDEYASKRGTSEIVSVADVMVEVAEKLGLGNLREPEALSLPKPAEQVSQTCPFCNKEIPARVADLSRCDSALLRELLNLAEQRERRAAVVEAKREEAEQQLAEEQASKAARKRKDHAGWQGSVSGPDAPHSLSETPSSAEPSTRMPTMPKASAQGDQQHSQQPGAWSPLQMDATAPNAQAAAFASADAQESEPSR